jgi:hypothetical protein
LFDLTAGLNVPGMVRGNREGVGDPYAIVPAIGRLRAMAVNSAMRTADPRGGIDATIAGERARAFDLDISNGRPPANWRAWTRDFSEVTSLRHGGMSGVIDTAFFARVDAFVTRHRAPPEVRASVDFHKGIHGWNYPDAARAADPLIRAAMRGDMWIDPDFLRDGAVMAMLQTGDRAGARDALRALELRSSRKPTDLRNQLLLSYVLDSAQTFPRRR